MCRHRHTASKAPPHATPSAPADVHVIGARNAYSALGSHERGQAGRPSVDDARPSHPGAASLTGPDAGPSRAGCPTAVCADAVVTTQWIGFHRIWRGSGRIFDTVELYLPASQVRTEAAFVAVPHALRAEMRGLGLPLREGLHAAAHAVLNVLPLHVVCNAGDVKAECDNPYATRYRPERLLLYDSQPGGVGLAAQVSTAIGWRVQELPGAVGAMQRAWLCVHAGCAPLPPAALQGAGSGGGVRLCGRPRVPRLHPVDGLLPVQRGAGEAGGAARAAATRGAVRGGGRTSGLVQGGGGRGGRGIEIVTC